MPVLFYFYICIIIILDYYLCPVYMQALISTLVQLATTNIDSVID